MPVVTFDYNDFLNLLGYKLSREEFLERIPLIGADLDRVEDSSISIEFFPNRPDLLSVEGIARAARAFFGFEKGLKKYKTEKSNIFLKVDPSVKKIRPFIVTALVKNIEMTDELISSLMDMQEKLHFGLGRERKKVAIGVHDFDQIKLVREIFNDKVIKLKIGGAGAKNDIRKAFELNINGLILPMAETAYAVENFLNNYWYYNNRFNKKMNPHLPFNLKV